MTANLVMIYIGLFSNVIAYIAWFNVLTKILASQAESYLSSIPIAASIITRSWLNEIPILIALCGRLLFLQAYF